MDFSWLHKTSANPLLSFCRSSSSGIYCLSPIAHWVSSYFFTTCLISIEAWVQLKARVAVIKFLLWLPLPSFHIEVLHSRIVWLALSLCAQLNNSYIASHSHSTHSQLTLNLFSTDSPLVLCVLLFSFILCRYFSISFLHKNNRSIECTVAVVLCNAYFAHYIIKIIIKCINLIIC